jgi:hypothetical protein
MSAYFLRELFRISSGEELGRVFVQRNTGHAGFPAILAAFGVAIYFVA